MNLICTRHTETDWNKDGFLQGWTDISLNENGWIQAEELAKKLLHFKIDKIISSDLKRSFETAEILSKYLKAPVIKDSRLRECNFGTLEGKKKEEAAKLYPHNANSEIWHESFIDYNFEPFGGEGRDVVLRRQLSLLDDLKEDENLENVVIVGHGTAINTLLSHFKKKLISRGEFAEVNYP